MKYEGRDMRDERCETRDASTQPQRRADGDGDARYPTVVLGKPADAGAVRWSVIHAMRPSTMRPGAKTKQKPRAPGCARTNGETGDGTEKKTTSL